MRNRLSIIFFFSFLNYTSFSQDSSSKRKDSYYSNIFIKGEQGKQTIDIDVIKNGFEIAFSDSTLSIVHYTVCWDVWSSIICVRGNEKVFPPKGKAYSLSDIRPPLLLTIDDIRVRKDGREFKVPSLVYYVEDLYNKYMSLKNPMICHDKELRPVCYNDGNYIINFENSRFAGFLLADSSVFYNEKEKKLTINKLGWFDSSHFMPITFKLEASSILCTYGGKTIASEKMNSTFSKVEGLDFNMKPGRNFDTINFKANDRYYTLDISKNDFSKPSKGWRWEITERHDASVFQLTYQWKKNNPQFIIIQDDRLKFGLSISTSFKTGKKIWHIESSYVERIDGIITTTPYVQQYRYMYNKSGKLNNKNAKGAVNYCNCQ